MFTLNFSEHHIKCDCHIQRESQNYQQTKHGCEYRGGSESSNFGLIVSIENLTKVLSTNVIDLSIIPSKDCDGKNRLCYMHHTWILFVLSSRASSGWPTCSCKSTVCESNTFRKEVAHTGLLTTNKQTWGVYKNYKKHYVKRT